MDYVTKLSIACPVSGTERWQDAVSALEDARATVEQLLGHTLLEDCTDAATGELTPVIIVSDNGSCYKAAAFERYIRSRPELRHVRTRRKQPHTNGVVEVLQPHPEIRRPLPRPARRRARAHHPRRRAPRRL